MSEHEATARLRLHDEFGYVSGRDAQLLKDANNTIIGAVFDREDDEPVVAQDRAELIVTAVNAHDDMLAALKAALPILEHRLTSDNKVLALVAAAIAKGEAK